MANKNLDNRDDSAAFQRRFKQALYAFALVEFLVIAFTVFYKLRH